MKRVLPLLVAFEHRYVAPVLQKTPGSVPKGPHLDCANISAKTNVCRLHITIHYNYYGRNLFITITNTFIPAFAPLIYSYCSTFRVCFRLCFDPKK